ncbi:MAG: hypothetical protein HUJ72_08975 [Blautia sp.]|nr:hypothetical protein [Blautia sp.]
MKKAYLFIAGLVLVSLLSSGCGKKKENAQQAGQDKAEVTVTPTVQPTEAPQIVPIQQGTPTVTPEPEKNVIGKKTENAEKITLANKTGGTIKEFYIRPAGDDQNFGANMMVNGFVLKNGDVSTLYFDQTQNADGLFDLYVSYSEQNLSDCYFRSIPLPKISRIVLCMDTSGSDGIPYATYRIANGGNEVSTLNEVKERLGLLNAQKTQSAYDSTAYSQTDNYSSYNQGNTDYYEEEIPYIESSEGASAAEQFIGQSFSNLTESLGEPGGSSYEQEPETGETGYHYYNGYTVSTIVDEEGNEIVAGVW